MLLMDRVSATLGVRLVVKLLSWYGFVQPQARPTEPSSRASTRWLKHHYKRYDITHNPNNPDDKWYIVRLIKKVTTVSLKTVGIVEGLGGRVGV